MPSKKDIKKTHLCAHCQRTFNDRSNLKRHLAIHNSQKPFSCTVCCKSFTQRSNTLMHIKNKHCIINPKDYLQRRIHLFSKQCHKCNGHFLLKNKEDKTKFCDTCFEQALEDFEQALEDFYLERLLDFFELGEIS